MKGDKGMFSAFTDPILHVLTSFVEFSGTLLGFDDYVSKYIDCILPMICAN